MIKVDEVYPLDINSSIGPTGTIKRLFRNRDYFNKRGYDMTIFANHPVKKQLLTYKYALQPLVYLPGETGSNILKDKINAPGKLNKFKSRLKTFVESSKLLAYLRFIRANKLDHNGIANYLTFKRNADIIVFHVVNSAYYYYKLVKGTPAKTALFIHADGSDSGMFSKSHPKLVNTRAHKKMLEQLYFALEKVDKIVFISDIARQNFCAEHPNWAYKAISILNGIDDIKPISQKASSLHRFRLISSGTVTKRKGQYLVVEAMHRMNPDILKETHYTVVGTGPDFMNLSNLVNEYRLQDNVTLLGNVSNSEMHHLLCKENIFVLMSNNEGLPISILEAMRAGLPIISTLVAGIPEEVDARNGFLINPDVDQLTELFNKLPDYNWEELAKASRRRFETEFTFEIMRKKYADMFDGLIE